MMDTSIQQYDLEQFNSPTNTNGMLMGNFTGSNNSHQLLDEAAEIIDDDEESMYKEDDFEEVASPGQQISTNQRTSQEIIEEQKVEQIAQNQLLQEPKTLIRAN